MFTTALERLTARLTTRSDFPRWGYPVGAAVFVAIVAYAISTRPDLSRADPSLLLVVMIVGVPLTIVVNSLEYAAMAEMSGRPTDRLTALQVSIAGSAANLLPLPGAALVRAGALRRAGDTYRGAAASTAVIALVWAAAAFVLAGGALLLRADLAGGALVAVGSVAAVIARGLIARRVSGRQEQLRITSTIVVIELSAVLVAAMRVMATLAAIGQSTSVAGGLSMSLASVVSAAAGFVPGGLGIREGLSGLIAPLVAIPASAGVLAAALDRFIGIGVLAVAVGGGYIVGGPLRTRKREPRETT